MSLGVAGAVQIGTLTLEIDLHGGRGEVMALVGPNGSGKSTTLRALAGLAQLTDGRILIGARTVDDADESVFVPAERRGVGILFQDPLLFPHLDVLDNVAFGLRAQGRSRREARTAAQMWLDRLAIADLSGRRPSTLSGGQGQRVALARALSVEPELLLLDEPLSALDPGARDDVVDWLRDHLRTFAGTTIIVSHDPDAVARLCDRVSAITLGDPNRLSAVSVSPDDHRSVAGLMAGR